jgi:hypothetical protein
MRAIYSDKKKIPATDFAGKMEIIAEERLVFSRKGGHLQKSQWVLEEVCDGGSVE